MTILANNSNRSRARRTISNASKQHVHGKFHGFSLESKLKSIPCNRNEPLKLTHGKLQSCQNIRGDMHITAETAQTYDLYKSDKARSYDSTLFEILPYYTT